MLTFAKQLELLVVHSLGGWLIGTWTRVLLRALLLVIAHFIALVDRPGLNISLLASNRIDIGKIFLHVPRLTAIKASSFLDCSNAIFYMLAIVANQCHSLSLGKVSH